MKAKKNHDVIDETCYTECLGEIKAVYLFKNADTVIENGIIRIKRKYGKHKRTPIKLGL